MTLESRAVTENNDSSFRHFIPSPSLSVIHDGFHSTTTCCIFTSSLFLPSFCWHTGIYLMSKFEKKHEKSMRKTRGSKGRIRMGVKRERERNVCVFLPEEDPRWAFLLILVEIDSWKSEVDCEVWLFFSWSVANNSTGLLLEEDAAEDEDANGEEGDSKYDNKYEATDSDLDNGILSAFVHETWIVVSIGNRMSVMDRIM